jgi:hypothetical protein
MAKEQRPDIDFKMAVRRDAPRGKSVDRTSGNSVEGHGAGVPECIPSTGAAPGVCVAGADSVCPPSAC